MTSNPQPAESRILTALLLAPMSSLSIANCLCLPLQGIRRHLESMAMSGEVRRENLSMRAYGRPWMIYTLTEKGESMAKELMS